MRPTFVVSIGENGSSNEMTMNLNERKYRDIADGADYAILLLDKDGTIKSWSVGAQKIKGYDPAEVIGQNLSIFYSKADRENQLPEQLLEDARTHGATLYEGWRVRKDGKLFWAVVVITALRDSGNNIVGFSKNHTRPHPAKSGNGHVWLTMA